jgi:hypothetical protein
MKHGCCKFPLPPIKLGVIEAEALRLYPLAAEQGEANGQLNLGYAYQTGFGGLPKDDVEAVKLYRLPRHSARPPPSSELPCVHSGRIDAPVTID